MAKKPKQTSSTLERRVAALERDLEELRKVVGDLKYEIEQMTED
jgi:uncharacterized coiled-coil protein SlyX